jgi:hypothetical protein
METIPIFKTDEEMCIFYTERLIKKWRPERGSWTDYQDYLRYLFFLDVEQKLINVYDTFKIEPNHLCLTLYDHFKKNPERLGQCFMSRPECYNWYKFFAMGGIYHFLYRGQAQDQRVEALEKEVKVLKGMLHQLTTYKQVGELLEVAEFARLAVKYI